MVVRPHMELAMNKLSFGTDPEFMIVDRNGNYKSAIPIVKASKEKKLELGNNHKLFYDNVLMEMNIETAYGENDLISKLSDAFCRASRTIYPYRMLPQASCVYPPSECQHQDAKVFGCDPEFCAYEMMQLSPPQCEDGNTFRSAGGHIHLGYMSPAYPLLAPIVSEGSEDEDRSERDWGRVWVVRMMDLFVGLPSLLIDKDPSSAQRRKLYGKAGTHRPKEDYGVEYRATSNFWLKSPKLTSLVYRLSCFAVNFVAERKHLSLWKDNFTCKEYSYEKLCNTINNSDIKEAKSMMESVVKKYLSQELYLHIFRMSEPDNYNFYAEWGIPL